MWLSGAKDYAPEAAFVNREEHRPWSIRCIFASYVLPASSLGSLGYNFEEIESLRSVSHALITFYILIE